MLNLEQQIFKQIEKSKHILLVFSKTQEGDAIASALAWLAFLKQASCQVDLAGETSKENSILSFLPNYTEIKPNLNNLRRFIVSVNISQAKVHQIKYLVENESLNFIISPSEGWFKPEDVSTRAAEFKYDLIITLGVSDLESLGSLYDQNVEFFYKTTIINIDNQPNNEDFGQINFIDLNAAALSEITFYLLKNYQPAMINEDIATCLLTGIIQKTKNFKSTNLTPRTLLTSSELIALKARREDIINNLYRSRNLKTLKLWGKLLNNLVSENNESLIWSKLTIQDLQGEEATLDSLNDLIDELIINVPKASLVAIFCETPKKETILMLYSLKNINVLTLLSNYQFKGTMKAASLEIKQDIETASLIILPEIKNKLEKLQA